MMLAVPNAHDNVPSRRFLSQERGISIRRVLSPRILMFLIWASLIAIGIWDLSRQALRSVIWFGSLVFLVSVYFKFRRIPPCIHMFLAILALLNLFGEHLFGLYYIWESYDKLLHLVGSCVLCLFIFHLARGKIPERRLLMLLAGAAALSVGIIWEIIEYLSYRILGWQMLAAEVKISMQNHFLGVQGPLEALDRLHDSTMDMVSNILGIMAFMAGHFLYGWRKALFGRSLIV